jgi:hypothetical protein
MPVCTSQSPAPRTEKDYLDAQKTQRIGNGRWCNSPVTYVAVSHVCPIYILSLYVLYISGAPGSYASVGSPDTGHGWGDSTRRERE